MKKLVLVFCIFYLIANIIVMVQQIKHGWFVGSRNCEQTSPYRSMYFNKIFDEAISQPWFFSEWIFEIPDRGTIPWIDRDSICFIDKMNFDIKQSSRFLSCKQSRPPSLPSNIKNSFFEFGSLLSLETLIRIQYPWKIKKIILHQNLPKKPLDSAKNISLILVDIEEKCRSTYMMKKNLH